MFMSTVAGVAVPVDEPVLRKLSLRDCELKGSRVHSEALSINKHY